VNALLDKGQSLYDSGKYAEALPIVEQAAALAERRLGAHDVDRAMALLLLGRTCTSMGDFQRAHELFTRSVAFFEKAPQYGPNHPTIYASLNNLAEVYQKLGDYPMAEQAARRGVAVNEKHPEVGPQHFQTAAAAEALASVLEGKGDYAEAEDLLQRALTIKQKHFGAESPEVAFTLHQLASLYYNKGDYDRALPLHPRVIALREKAHGPDHPRLAISINNYARLYRMMGEYEKAEPLQRRALRILQKALPAGHPQVAHALSNVGELLMSVGKNDEARPLFQESADLRKKALGTAHPLTATSLHNLAVAAAGLGDWQAAAAAADDARRTIRRYVARVLPSLSDREQIQFLKVRDEANLHGMLSLGLARADDPRIAGLSAGWLANAKSVGQEAAAERVLVAREGNDPAAAKLADELTGVRRQLAALRQAVTSSADSKDLLRKIDELEQQERSLIRSLGIAVPWVEKDDPWVGIDAIRKALPAGSVFVDIARFAVRDFAHVARQGTPFNPFLPARYAAWIVPPAGVGDVRVVDLGDANRIDGLIDAARAKLAAHSEPQGAIATAGEGAAEKELAAAMAPLAQLTIQPILKAATAVAGAAPKELVISADGALWLVPFAALPLEDGRYAIETTALRLVTSGRDLVDPAAAERRSKAVGKPLIMAAPDFDSSSPGRATGPGAGRRAVSPIGRPLTTHRLPKVDPLPGTLDEAQAVAPSVGLLADAQPDVFTGADATEARFKSVSRPPVAILATHGFFLPDQQLEKKLLLALQRGNDGGSRGLTDSQGEALENPLTRCGLLFAGCNRAASSSASDATEDGVLTGLEIIGCDLRGTKLVVLSACQTGLGDVAPGQGVSGLRQAFQLAGARSVVSTLWSVPDRETAELSAAMFANLAAGKTTSDALRQAQVDMINARRRQREAAHPIFWASFNVTGQ
jgi:CHAT domain-containing protein/tetratricopeptide (TPR) repeat protein